MGSAPALNSLAIERLVLSGYAATQERIAMRIAAVAGARALEGVGRSRFAALHVAANWFSIEVAALEHDLQLTLRFPIEEWHLVLATDEELSEIRNRGDVAAVLKGG